MNNKTIYNKQAVRAVLGVGAFLLTACGTQAQGVFLLNNGNNGRSNGFGQNYGVFGGANGMAAYPVGGVNSGYGYSFYGVGGLTSPAATAAYFGYGIPSLFGSYPYGYATNGFGYNGSGFNGNGSIGNGTLYAGSNISVVDSPLSGGFATVNPAGATFVGPNGQPSNPALTNGGSITPLSSRTGGITRLPVNSGRNGSAASGTQAGNEAAKAALPSGTEALSPLSLKQMIGAQRDANFNLRIGWRGDPAMIDSMSVTLLNQYHLPLVANSASSGQPVTFAANPNVYAARYYRADIRFADGAVTTVTGTITR